MLHYQSRGGQYGKNIISRLFLTKSRFIHDSLSCWFYYFASSPEQYNQTTFPIIKSFKVTKKENKIRMADIYNNNNNVTFI